MSNARHAPYGADDDPFLTHPAGPGQGQRRAPSPEYWADDRPVAGYNGYDAPRQAGHSPVQQPRHVAPQQAAGHTQPSYAQPHYAQGHYSHDAYTPDTYAQDLHRHGAQAHSAAPYPAAPYPAAPYPEASYRAAQQSGNFRPRMPAYAPHPNSAAQPQYSAPNAYAGPEYDGFDPPNPMPHSPAAHSPSAHSPAAHSALRPAPAQHSFAAPPRHIMARSAPAPQPSAAQQHADLPHYADLRGSFALPVGPQAGQMVQWAGALCTVLAVVGAGYWGYKLAVRDALGIPVVRATLGPLRLAPETPGGDVSAHQGLAVNAIPATGASAPVPDQITLAPQSSNLAPEDTSITEAGSFAAAQIETTGETTGEGQIETLAGASDQILAQPQAGNSTLANLADLPNSLPEDMPLTDAEAVERALEAALAEGGDTAVSDAPQAIAPEPQPAAEAAETASMSNTDPVAPPTAELDPASIPLGTPLVQLGAFDTPEIARAEWANLQTRFTELMAGKALVVEQGKSGGKNFYRVRAHGFETAVDARRFCAAILAENGSCLTVDQR